MSGGEGARHQGGDWPDPEWGLPHLFQLLLQVIGILTTLSCRGIWWAGLSAFKFVDILPLVLL